MSSNGAGFDTVDVDACTAAGVIAVNQAGGNKEAVAEHVMAMMLTLSKRIVETDRYMRRQSDIPRNDFIGHDLTGRTIGIVGLGNVGSRVAELCRGLFRMRVLSYDPYQSEKEIAAKGAEKVTLDALLAQSDYVSINCPRNKETRNMIGAGQYAMMQKHAYFITTARGGIHDEAALAEALAARRIAGAGLDVWEKEPPPHTHPLMAFDNVVISPHNRRRYRGIAQQHRPHRRRADAGHPRRQATAAPVESGSVAGLLRAVRTHPGLQSAALAGASFRSAARRRDFITPQRMESYSVTRDLRAPVASKTPEW